MNPMTESSMVTEPLVDDRSRELDGAPSDQHLGERAGANKSLMRRLAGALTWGAVLIGGVVFGLYKMRVHIPQLNTPKIYAYLDSMVARAEQLKGRIVGHSESAKHEGEEANHEHKLMVTSPMEKDVTITQEYVCQIHSRKHIDVCALEDGYLEAIPIREGQAVNAGDVLFEVMPVLYKARWSAKVAERDLAQLELNNTKRLAEKNAVSPNEVKLFEARLARTQAEVDLAAAELNFTKVTARFDGIVDRLKVFQGSLVKEGDILTTLSDNSVMWVYFNVPEKRYLEYMAELGQNKQSADIELILANHSKYPHLGKLDPAHNIGAIEANVNNENGNIAFRADFPNPPLSPGLPPLLRHGQTGKVLINRALHGAMVIPQRATFENLAKRYVYVVDKEDVVHQREIDIQHELEDIYVIGKELDVKDKILLEGIRQVRDGDKLEEYEFLQPVQVMANQKNRAE